VLDSLLQEIFEKKSRKQLQFSPLKMCSSQSEPDVTSPLSRISRKRKVITADSVIGELELTDDEKSEKSGKLVEADSNDADFDPDESDSMPKIKKRGRPRKKTLKKKALETSNCDDDVADNTNVNKVHVEERKSIDEQYGADNNEEVDAYETEGVLKAKNSVYPPHSSSEYTAPEVNTRNVEMNDYITENRGQNDYNNNGERLQNYVSKDVDQIAGLPEFDTSTELMKRAPVKTAPLRIRSFSKPTRNQIPAIGSFSQVRPRQPGPLRQVRLLGPRPRYFRPIQPRPCQSQIRMNSQHTQTVFKPLVIKLDSPVREVSEVATQSAQGCSEGVSRNYSPKIMPDVTLPSGISITRTPSRSVEDLGAEKTNVATLKSLARALVCLGEPQGVKRLVTYQLSESQVQGLRVLGLNEHERIF